MSSMADGNHHRAFADWTGGWLVVTTLSFQLELGYIVPASNLAARRGFVDLVPFDCTVYEYR